MSLHGSAAKDATRHYQQRFSGKIPADHFRLMHGIWVSSIGIGTYLGNYDVETDSQYQDAIVAAVESGCNVIDTAVNYRCQRSERAVGTAIKKLTARGFAREEIVIATKGGFIPFDSAPPKDPRGYFNETFVKTGVARLSDVVGGHHCMTPEYLLHQLDCSRRNIDLDCIDIYYVHNPEMQLGKITRQEFNERLRRAFEALEGAVSAGKIRMYGTATWNGYRNEPSAEDYLSLSDVVDLAIEAGGPSHHFKIIQLPLNLGMTEALALTNQQINGKAFHILGAAQALDVAVMCSASVLQGQLTHSLPAIIGEAFPGLETDGQRAIQFVRSTPGVTTALVGMKNLEHVRENLKAAKIKPASWEQYSKLFQTAETN